MAMQHWAMASKDRYLRYQGAASRDRASDEAHRVSQTDRLFDPLGWLAPVTIAAKIMVQTAWLQRREWDEPLRTIEADTGGVLCLELRSSAQVRIGTSTNQVEIHGFANACERAYAAGYLRTIEERKVRTSLVVAESCPSTRCHCRGCVPRTYS